MTARAHSALPALSPALFLALVIAGCGPKPAADANLDSLDAELTNTAASEAPGKDPALTSALQSQIMVDPALAQQSNADTVRPPAQPYAAPVPADGIAIPDNASASGNSPATGPLMKAPAPRADCPGCDTAKQAVTLGGLVARQRAPGTAACVAGMRYSANWATRLGELALYPQARLVEAAGNAAGGCALRAATFTTGAPVDRVIDWYYTRTVGIGFRSEHQAREAEHVLGGDRKRDQAAFILFARPRDGGGTQVDLIYNRGN